MAIERWNDEKLDGLADIVSGLGIKVQDLTDTVQGLAHKIDQTTDIANSNARVVQALANAMAEAAEERREIIQLIKQQHSDIRGLQTENQRMWEILFSQRNQNDNPDAEAV